MQQAVRSVHAMHAMQQAVRSNMTCNKQYVKNTLCTKPYVQYASRSKQYVEYARSNNTRHATTRAVASINATQQSNSTCSRRTLEHLAPFGNTAEGEHMTLNADLQPHHNRTDTHGRWLIAISDLYIRAALHELHNVGERVQKLEPAYSDVVRATIRRTFLVYASFR